MKDLQTIILAAGKGTRMKSDVPKVLHDIWGQPVLRYVLDVVDYVGSLKTYVITGHKNELIRDYLGEDIQTLIQKKLQGTADAVKTAADFFQGSKGDVLVLCGDTPLLDKKVIKKLVTQHKRSKSVCTLLTANVKNPRGYGRILRDDFGNVCVIREEKDASTEEKKISEINVGVYCFDASMLFDGLDKIPMNQKKKEFYLTDIVALFREQGFDVKGLMTDDYREGLGINDRKDLARAHDVIKERVLNDLMSKGVTIVDPTTTYISKNVKIGKDTVIYPMTVIEPNVRIAEGCSIGPFARVRSGTTLGKNVCLGNFVEVSRTTVGDGTCAKHFSYLGDADLGRSVNIGAGVVTANYDGKNKCQTVIKDQAFIGSGSMLVAPLKIGKKSMVGSGSVVTKNTKVPDGSVLFGAPAKISVKDCKDKQ